MVDFARLGREPRPPPLDHVYRCRTCGAWEVFNYPFPDPLVRTHYDLLRGRHPGPLDYHGAHPAGRRLRPPAPAPARVLLVAGGRTYGFRRRVFEVLDAEDRRRNVTALLHGGARGADALAGEWAAARDVPVHVEPADWTLHGKAAGPRRNRALLRAPGLPVTDALLFPGGPGTADMARALRAAGVPYREPERGP